MAKPRLSMNVILRKGHEWLGVGGTISLGIIALSCPFIAHKGDGTIGHSLKMIHYGEFLPAEWKWVWIDLQGLILILLVISGWLMHRRAVKRAAESAAVKARADLLVELKASGITTNAAVSASRPALAKTPTA